MSPKSYELGPLEMEVMGILSPNHSFSVSDIQVKLKSLNHDLAYTTVMTVLMRLHKKGYLNRTKEGRQYLYEHANTISKLQDSVLTKFRRTLFRNHALKPILAFLDHDDNLSKAELLELKNLVEQKIKKTEKK